MEKLLHFFDKSARKLYHTKITLTTAEWPAYRHTKLKQGYILQAVKNSHGFFSPLSAIGSTIHAIL